MNLPEAPPEIFNTFQYPIIHYNPPYQTWFGIGSRFILLSHEFAGCIYEVVSPPQLVYQSE